MKELLKVSAALIVFILAALAALTFTRNFNRQPSVLLTDKECAPPCWQGIRPGQTTVSGAYKVLDNFAGINKDTILGEYDRNEKLIRIFWFFQRPVEDSMGSLNIDGEQVIAINISTVNALKIADLIERTGDPQFYWTIVGQRENGEQYLDIVILSPSRGYVAEMIVDIEPGSDQVEISSSTPVFRVTYFSPEMYQELLETRILIDKPPSRRGPLQPWSGFGAISVPTN